MASVLLESEKESYDVVVVGSGLGGLSAASLLALTGHSVLVVERHAVAGGYAHGFRRKSYTFDSAVHLTSGAVAVAYGGGALIHDLLALLGVRDRVEFVPLDHVYHASFPGFRLAAPAGLAPYLHAHADHFPHEARGLRAFWKEATRLNREVLLLPSEVTLSEVLGGDEAFPHHHRYAAATVQDVLDDHLTDPRLKAAIGALWTYMGLPPSRLAFSRWAPMMLSFLHTGAFHCRGGFQRLVDAFVAALRQHGGELLLRSRVQRVLVEDGRAVGVRLENGQQIAARHVIANADARQTFEELVGPEHLPADFLAALRALRPSLSTVIAYLATDLDLADLDLGHETFHYDTWDHDATHARILQGEACGISVTVPTLVDPSLAPAGEHQVIAKTLVPYTASTSWRTDKAAFAAALLARVEELIPDLRSHLTFAEGATPRTMERYTLNQAGAIYGWEQSPEQAGINRLGHRTPVEGLWLSGHWTQPGSGVITVLVSGLQTVQLLLGLPDVGTLLRTLGRPGSGDPVTRA